MTSTESVPTTATTPSGRRGLGIAVTGSVLSGGAVLLTVGRVWLHYDIPRDGLADVRATATGHAVAGAAATLALVVLAGVVVLPATSGLGRRIAGVVIALAGLGVSYLAVLTIVLTTDQLDLPEASTYTGGRATAWPWIALAAAVAAIGTGVFATIASAEWPAMGRRYESAGSARRGPVTEASLWDRLDEGDDPTV